MKGDWGTFTREKPCGKCGGNLFYVRTQGCVACNRARGSEHRVKRTKERQEADKPTTERARKSSEKATDRSGVTDFLSRKW